MTLLTALNNLTDCRRKQAQKYELENIVFLSILAIIANANSYRDIATFIKNNFKYLNKKLKLKWKDPPAYTTIRNILLGVNHKELDKVMYEHVLNYLEENNLNDLHIAIDGKSLRGSFDAKKEKDNIHILYAFITKYQLILSQRNVTKLKTNEIPVAQEMIKRIDMDNVVYSMDALHCQSKTILEVKKKEQDILVQVKENQKELLRNCQTRTRVKRDIDRYRTKEKQHGRMEEREYSLYKGLTNTYDGDFRGIKSVIRVDRKRSYFSKEQLRDMHSSERSYYICTKDITAKESANIIRRHWEIENCCNNVLDTSFQEDRSRIRISPEIMATLRAMGLNVLRMNNCNNVRQTRMEMAWNRYKLSGLKYLWN